MKISKNKLMLSTILLGTTNLVASNFDLHDLMDEKSKGMSFGGLTSDLLATTDGVGLVLLNSTGEKTNTPQKLILEQELTNSLLIALKGSNIGLLKTNILESINNEETGIENVLSLKIINQYFI